MRSSIADGADYVKNFLKIRRIDKETPIFNFLKKISNLIYRLNYTSKS